MEFSIMPRLTTHVLDMMHGQPASGVTVVLYRREESGALRNIARFTTNEDGRCSEPLLDQSGLTKGLYQLDFYIGDYYRAAGVTLPEPAFLDVVPISFGVADPQSHYHVPLLVSPFGYSTYRGS